MAYKHGMYVEEIETSTKITTSESILPLFVVVAPTHRATEPKINEPIIAYKLADVAKYLGYESGNHDFTSNKVAEIFFQYEGIGPVAFINAFDHTKHYVTTIKEALPLIVDAGIISKKNIDLSTIEVYKLSADTEKLVLDSDYYATLNSNGYVNIELDDEYNGGVFPTVMYVSYKTVDPKAVTTAEIIGGADADNNKTGLELINSIYAKYRIVPSLIAAPKYSSDSAIAAILKAKANNLNTFYNCMALIDHADDVLFSDFPAWKISKNINDPAQICLYGYGTLGEYYYEPSVLLAAQMCRVDMKNDDVPFESPSNKSLPIDGACIIKDGKKVALNLEFDEANYLNSNGIVTIYNSPSGWVSWGNQTACYPSNTDPKDNTINWKRLMFYYKKTFIQNLFGSLDGAVTKIFIENCVNTFNKFFNSEIAEGHILAGKISYNISDNGVSNLIEGTITFQIVVTFSPNAQAIIGTFEVDVDSLNELLSA